MSINKSLKNKKNAFTFAEVLMMLILMGIIIKLAIPIYTERNYDNRLYASVYKAFQTVNATLIATQASHKLDMDNYCNAFTNTVNYSQNDSFNCMNNFVSDYTTNPDKPNFVFINGVRVYGMENAFRPTNPEPLTVRVNIRRGLYKTKHADVANDSSLNDSDVLGFHVWQNGNVMPRYTSEQAVLDKYN
jgi:hypothetical protein